MKIAILGTRGIPANYGGFETFAEQLSVRLAQKGHEVTVYCRKSNYDYDTLGNRYRGVRLVVLPAIRNKYLDTVLHTFFSILHSLNKKFDVILVCNSVNSSFTFMPRLVGTRVAINVDGLEWQRAKWNKLGQIVYRVSEWLATIFADVIVTDAVMIQKYYRKKFQKDSVFIPYGSTVKPVRSNHALEKYKLKPRDYILYVSRFEPENNPLLVVRAFEKTKTSKKLVMVGDAPYNADYIRELRATKDPRIIFTGYVFGDEYAELQSNAYMYIQATEVGGTHPALLEGMGFGNCILANDVPEHREVIGNAGFYFTKDVDDLSQKIQFLAEMSEKQIGQYRSMAKERIRQRYTWDAVVNQYEQLFEKLSHNINPLKK